MITPPQSAVLAIVAARGSVALSNRTDATHPCVSATVAYRLAGRGLLALSRPTADTHGAWAGTTDAAVITDAGRAAL